MLHSHLYHDQPTTARNGGIRCKKNGGREIAAYKWAIEKTGNIANLQYSLQKPNTN